jgi:hypothetical protein
MQSTGGVPRIQTTAITLFLSLGISRGGSARRCSLRLHGAISLRRPFSSLRPRTLPLPLSLPLHKKGGRCNVRVVTNPSLKDCGSLAGASIIHRTNWFNMATRMSLPAVIRMSGRLAVSVRSISAQRQLLHLPWLRPKRTPQTLMSKRTSEGSCDESLYRIVPLWLRSLQRLGSLLQTFLQDCVTLHGTCSKRCVVYHGSSARLPREPNHTLVLYTIRVHSL